jgi:hypothetical protein
MHWKEDIRKWGMPLYFSTNHFEPKHKQLKLIKEHQTNNRHHCRDILKMEWIAQYERTTSWKSNVLSGFQSSSSPLLVMKFILVKKYLQAAFLNEEMTPTDFVETAELIGLRVELFRSHLMKLKYIVYKNTSYAAAQHVSVRGSNLEIWFGRIVYLFGYFIRDVLQDVFLKIHWYKCSQPVHLSSISQFTLIKAAVEGVSSIVSVTAVLGLILKTSSFYPDNVQYPLLLDACYFVKKDYIDGSEEEVEDTM